MDTVTHASRAEVGISAYRAHVADAANRIDIATITCDLLVNCGVLLELLLFKVVLEHFLKARVAVL